MKKIFCIFTALILFFSIISITTISSAATLDTIDVDLSKEKVAPGEEVSVIVNFGQQMGSYTVTVNYDTDIFDYIGSESGADNSVDGEAIVTYHYVANGSESPRTSEKLTFKANSELTSSNPTDLTVTITGLANPDAVSYQDPDDSYIKDVLVEPNYVNYSLDLSYTGIITKDKEKDMKLTTTSTMGKNYDHVRLIAEVTAKPEDNATAKLLATQDDGNEIDLFVSGWGEADGYALGGRNVKQELALRGVFSHDGKYTVHIKLIDRDDSDATIAEKNFDITVGETKVAETEEKLPETYPSTGITEYIFVIFAIIILTVMYFIFSKHE